MVPSLYGRLYISLLIQINYTYFDIIRRTSDQGDQKLLLANSYNMQRRSWKCEFKNKQKSPMKKDSISIIKLRDFVPTFDQP